MAGSTLLKRFLSKKTLVIVITILAMVARFWKVEFIPFQNDADELAFVFAGQSMLEKGVPISWSSFAYDEKYVYSVEPTGDEAFNTAGEITFISPWFDHPYFLSLVQGVWTEALGYRFPSTPPSLVLRIPMLGFALVTLILFWKVVSALFSEKVALITYFIFALSPSFVIGQRMVVGENVIVPLLLAAVLILVKKMKDKYWLLPILTAVAILTKFTGVLVLLVIGLWFVLKKDWRQLAIITASSIGLFALLYLPFVIHLGWNEFISITSKQSFRLLGWVNPAFIMANPGFHHYIFYDLSYYVFLVIGGAGTLLASKSKQATFLQLATLGALALLWSTSAEQDALGWYKLPVFTLLAVMMGYALEKISMQVMAVVGGLLVVNNLGLVRFIEHPLPTTERLRSVVGLLVLSPIVAHVYLNKKMQRALVSCVFVAIAVVYSLQALYVADSFYDARCQHKKCPIPTITITQWVKEQL